MGTAVSKMLGRQLSHIKTCSSIAARYLSSSAKEKRIGVVGMGHVGTAVTNNVANIMDIKPELCRGFPESIQVLKTPREVALESDVIISGLPKPPHVKEMFDGSDGLLAGMSEGKIWIDHSTTDHQQNKIFTAQLQAKESFLLECPITGGLEALK